MSGRSASFRLRFRFVRVVRAVCAGEAKLRGRMTIVVLIAGPPSSEYPRVCARPFASLVRLFTLVLKDVWCLMCAGNVFCFCIKVLRHCCFLFDNTALGEHGLQKHPV